MRLFTSTSVSAIAAALLIFPAVSASAQSDDGGVSAQQGVDPIDTTDDSAAGMDDDTIIVYGGRLMDQVDTVQPAVLELDPEDIAAYGAGSISELIEQLGSQVTSSRGRGDGGRPIILVNGVRISSFREMRSYPPESIEKLEVFTEEVAQQYGYSPDQRVVNIILKNNFSSREIEAEYGQPFEGGFSTQEVEATYLQISGPSRINVNLEWNNSSILTEAERGVVQSSVPTLATDPDPALYRSLVSDTSSLEGTVNWTTTLGAGNSLSLNATYERDNTLNLQGLDTVLLTDPLGNTALRSFNANDPLTVDTKTSSYSGGATLNMGLGDWQVTGTLDATHTDSTSETERNADTSALVAAAAAGTLALDGDLGTFADAGFEEAHTKTDSANALVTARGHPVYLPGGEVSVTLDAGYEWDRINGTDTRNPGIETDLTRGTLVSGINIGVPITSRNEDFGGAIGDISLNFSAGLDHLSDFGTLYDWSAGVTWGITETLTFNANHINRDAAPTLSQLGSPEVATPNVSVFDLTNNETVLATVITGGNPFLPAQNQSDWNVGLQWELPFIERSNVSVNYIRTNSTDVSASFPTLTADIEAAFPDRVTRDADGTLVQINRSPVTYASEKAQRLQFGINLSGDFASDDAGGSGNSGGGNRGGNNGGPVAMGGQGGPGGPGGAAGAGGARDPERFAQMRATFCEADAEVLRERMNASLRASAAGEAPPVGEDGQPLAVPAQMLERLAGEDGIISAEEFETMRTRMCSGDGPPATAGGPAGGPGGGDGGRGGGGGPGAGGGGGPRLPFGRGGGGNSGGRWFFNGQYNLELQNEVLIAEGLPILDRLDGVGGSQARHSGNFRLGTFYNGFGMFWNGSYTGNSKLVGSAALGGTDLDFHDYFTLDVRVFADLSQREKLVEAVPFLDGSRVSIGIDNIFDARQRVTDSAGDVPIRYQPFLIDPVGRSFEVEFRKMF